MEEKKIIAKHLNNENIQISLNTVHNHDKTNNILLLLQHIHNS